ncbi:MAG: ATP-binding cassette domain-containing protein, partial [Pirellulaceae bacterium]|nr:ATP-binding cassette domain-containing protein [Pirellulaceae bacterium]
LECDSLSVTPHYSVDDVHPQTTISPEQRFLALLDLERRDIWTIVLFAFVAGILTLATPLAVESLVNVVSWGTYVQPLIVLGLILLICLGIAGVLRVLQTVVVELIQRRQFVRIVSDLSHRFPRANQDALSGKYPRELANRVFDIMTIQKSTAVLLLDGVSVVLTTVLGLVLLAFYHPFLLGFDIVLLMSMISITWILGGGGIRTAIEESKTKYKVAHWLQDVIASPTAFKTGGGESLAIQRANVLTAEYITARRRQFRVVLRQVAFAITLQVIASTAVLALGGWLVIDRQLTLGQLVASELVVTVVVGAFAKAGKSLEKFYDLMAGMDKVGQLIDIPTDPRHEIGKLPDGPIAIRWGELHFNRLPSSSTVAATAIEAGSSVAIVGDDVDGRSDLARVIAGLQKPTHGLVQVGGFDSLLAASGRGSRLVGYAGEREIFCGTLRENIDLGRVGLSQSRIRQVLDDVGLSETILRLPDALQTSLQTGGHPLTASQVTQLIIARAIVAKPKALVINGLLDGLTPDIRAKIWNCIASHDAAWTLVVVTGRDDIARMCDSQISIRKNA